MTPTHIFLTAVLSIIAVPAGAETLTLSETQTRLVDFRPGTHLVQLRAFEKISNKPDRKELLAKLAVQYQIFQSLLRQSGYEGAVLESVQDPEIDHIFARIPSVEPSPYIQVGQIKQEFRVEAKDLTRSEVKGLVSQANAKETRATLVKVWGDAYAVDASEALIGDFLPFRVLGSVPFASPQELASEQMALYRDIQEDLLQDARAEIRAKCLSFSKSLEMTQNCDLSTAEITVEESFEPESATDEGKNRVGITLTATWSAE